MRDWLLSALLSVIGSGVVLLTSPDAKRWLRPVAVGLKLLPARHEAATYKARIEDFVRENRDLTDPCTALLGDSLSEDFPVSEAARLGIVNRGISGDRVADLERRLDASVLAAPCRTVMLLGGTNDVVLDGADPTSVAAALLGIAERLQAAGRRVFVLSLPPVEGSHAAAYPRVRALNRELADAAPARGLGWLDLNAELEQREEGRPNLLADDGLHLSPEGYARFASLVERTLRPRAAGMTLTAGTLRSSSTSSVISSG